jgi:uncharacterized protein YndB with AHSA1/START domain
MAKKTTKKTVKKTVSKAKVVKKNTPAPKKTAAKKAVKPSKKVAPKRVIKPAPKKVLKKAVKAVPKKAMKKAPVKVSKPSKKLSGKKVIAPKAKVVAKPIKKVVAKKIAAPKKAIVPKSVAPKKVIAPKVIAPKPVAKPKVEIKKAVVAKPAPKPIIINKPAPAPTPMKHVKEPEGKFEIEYVMHSAVPVLFEMVSTPSGLSEWFCDDVNVRNGICTFFWDKEEQDAKILKEIPERLIRFQWTDHNDGSFFEFRIEQDEMTNDTSLIVTDFALTNEERVSATLLWDSEIDKLKKKIGSIG